MLEGGGGGGWCAARSPARPRCPTGRGGRAQAPPTAACQPPAKEERGKPHERGQREEGACPGAPGQAPAPADPPSRPSVPRRARRPSRRRARFATPKAMKITSFSDEITCEGGGRSRNAVGTAPGTPALQQGRRAGCARPPPQPAAGGVGMKGSPRTNGEKNWPPMGCAPPPPLRMVCWSGRTRWPALPPARDSKPPGGKKPVRPLKGRFCASAYVHDGEEPGGGV